MKSEKLQFDRSLATDSEATYRLRTKSHHSLDAGIGGTFYSIPVDSYRNFRRILLYAAMRTISSYLWDMGEVVLAAANYRPTGLSCMRGAAFG